MNKEKNKQAKEAERKAHQRPNDEWGLGCGAGPTGHHPGAPDGMSQIVWSFFRLPKTFQFRWPSAILILNDLWNGFKFRSKSVNSVTLSKVNIDRYPSSTWSGIWSLRALYLLFLLHYWSTDDKRIIIDIVAIELTLILKSTDVRLIIPNYFVQTSVFEGHSGH